jgi:hypothetical protein
MIQQIQQYISKQRAKQRRINQQVDELMDRLDLAELADRTFAHIRILDDLETLATKHALYRNPLDNWHTNNPFFIDLDETKVIYIGADSAAAKKDARQTATKISLTDKNMEFLEFTDRNYGQVLSHLETPRYSTLFVIMPTHPLLSKQLYGGLQTVQPFCCSFIESYNKQGGNPNE